MPKEYELQTDVLETIVAATPVTKKHVALVTAFATRTEFRGARYVMTRDTFGERPARILDAAGGEVASDYSAWIDSELAAHGGSVRALWAAHKDRGLLLTEMQPVLHYFVHDRGGDQDNFVQIEVWEEQEFVERELFSSDEWGLPSADELRRGSSGFSSVKRFERRLLGSALYRLDSIIDVLRFNLLAEAAFGEYRRAAGDRQMIESNMTTGARRVVSVRELTPGYDRLQWPGRRFFNDWSESTAGVDGERLCTRWTLGTSDYTDAGGVRHMSFVPHWAHTSKIAQLKDTRKLDAYGLYGRLNQFDRRVGMRFAWYFYGLHGNLVRSGQIERVLEAAEEGLIVLPEHDYRVLRRWRDDPYGF